MFTYITKFLDWVDRSLSEDYQKALERIIAASATCPEDVERMVKQYERNNTRSFL